MCPKLVFLKLIFNYNSRSVDKISLKALYSFVSNYVVKNRILSQYITFGVQYLHLRK